MLTETQLKRREYYLKRKDYYLEQNKVWRDANKEHRSEHASKNIVNVKKTPLNYIYGSMLKLEQRTILWNSIWN